MRDCASGRLNWAEMTQLLPREIFGDRATQVSPRQSPTAEEENMNPRITVPVFALIAFLMLGVGQANASFPGKNGRIAFVQWPTAALPSLPI